MLLSQAELKCFRTILLLFTMVLAGGRDTGAQPKRTPPPQPVTTSWVTPLQSTPYPLEGRSYQEKVRIPVTVTAATTSAAQLQVKLLSVTANGIQNELLRQHFLPVKFEFIDSKFGAIVVPVNLTYPLPTSARNANQATKVHLVPMRQDLPQGNYDLVVIVSNKNAPQRAGRKISLQIVHPAAQLRAPDKLVIEQVQPWHRIKKLLGWDSNSALLLQETSGHSRVSDIQVQVRQDSSGRSYFGNSGIVFKSGAAAPGRQAVISYDSGNFPIGATTGNLEIKAPQLASPITVPFEVRTRNTRLLIVVFIWCGLVLGWGVRSLLMDRIKLNSARVQATVLSHAISRAYEQFKDTTFRGTVRLVLTELTDTTKSPAATVETITQVQQKAQAAFAEAMTDLQTRLKTQQERLRKLVEQVKVPWFLPPQMADTMKLFRARLSNDIEQLKEGTVADTEGTLDEALTKLIQQMSSDLSSWRNEVNNALSVFESQALPDIIATNSEDVTELRNKIKETSLTQADIDQLGVTLDAVGAVRHKLGEWLAPLPPKLQELATYIATELEMSTDDPSVHKLLDSINRLTSDTAKTATPEEFLEKFNDGQEGLNPIWNEVFTARLSALNISQTDRDLVLTPVKMRRYKEAALAASKLIAQTQTKNTAVPHTLWPPEIESTSRSIPRFRNQEEQYGPEIPAPPELIMLNVGQAQTALNADIRLQRVLLVCGFTLIGYFLFSDDFIGTGKEMITIFTWAFGLNLTVEALAQGIKDYPQQQPARRSQNQEGTSA